MCSSPFFPFPSGITCAVSSDPLLALFPGQRSMQRLRVWTVGVSPMSPFDGLGWRTSDSSVRVTELAVEVAFERGGAMWRPLQVSNEFFCMLGRDFSFACFSTGCSSWRSYCVLSWVNSSLRAFKTAVSSIYALRASFSSRISRSKASRSRVRGTSSFWYCFFMLSRRTVRERLMFVTGTSAVDEVLEK